MSEERESIMAKVRKALALASDGADDAECETALLMAQRMMAKHGIDMSEVEGGEEEKKEVVDEPITERGRTPFWKKSLAMVIGDNFRCYTYTRTGGGKSRIIFLGVKGDVELAKELFEFAVNVLEQSVRRYLRKERRERGEEYESTGLRNDFIIGFIDGLREKFSEQVKELNLMPMLVKDDALVEVYEKRSFTSGTRSRVQRGYDSSAYNSGHREGKSLSKHTRIGG
jgi:hypothetical protein